MRSIEKQVHFLYTYNQIDNRRVFTFKHAIMHLVFNIIIRKSKVKYMLHTTFWYRQIYSESIGAKSCISQY